MAVHLYRVLKPVKVASGHIALTPVQAEERPWVRPDAGTGLAALPGRAWYLVPDDPVWFPVGDVIGTPKEYAAGDSLAEVPIPKPHEPRKSHSGEHSAPKAHKRTPKKHAG